MKYLITIYFLISTFVTFSQNQTKLIPEQLKINQIKINELNNGSTEIKSDVVHMTDGFYELAPPVLVQRTKDSFSPAPRLWYFYSTPDSTVRSLNYRWYDAIYKPSDGIKAFDKSRLSKYQSLFEELAERVSIELGLKPTESIPEKVTDQQSRKFWKTIKKWETDKIAVQLEYFYAIQKEGNVSDLFVKLKVEWDDKKEKERIIEKSKHQQDSIALLYLRNVFEKKFEDCWKMLDEQVQKQTPRDQFDNYMNTISELYKKKDPFVLFMDGKQMMGFQNLNLYSYKRKSEVQVPKLIINFYFRNYNSLKVFGIRHQER